MKTVTVTLIPGDGTGPEIVEAVRRVVGASGAKIEWKVVDAGADVMEEYGTLAGYHLPGWHHRIGSCKHVTYADACDYLIGFRGNDGGKWRIVPQHYYRRAE